MTTRRRSGVSPVIATTILLGITVALGMGLWSFANAGVGTATQQYAEDVTDYSRFTSDRFVVPSVAYEYADGAPSTDDITVYVFNSGRFDTRIISLVISCKDCSNPADSLPDYVFNPVSLRVDPNDLANDDLNPDDNQQANESIDGIVPAKDIRHLDFDASTAGADFRDGYTYQIQVISETGAYQTIYQKY